MSDHYIPKEILQMIFHKLSIKDLFRCTLVCRSWYQEITSRQFLIHYLENPNEELLLLNFHVNNPDDITMRQILAQILHKLPLDSLFKCTAICKLWHSVIDSPQFISAHFQNPNQELLLLRFHINNTEHLSLRVSKNQTLNEYSSITPSFKSSHVIGSCKGVLCVSHDAGFIFSLWNPMVGNFLFLHKPANPLFGNSNVSGFGFSKELQDYRILLLVNQESTILAEMFSLKERSWKVVSSGEFDKCSVPNRAIPAFVNGALHCIASGVIIRNFLIVFDITNEVFRRMELPRSLMEVEIKGLSVFPFGDSSIAVVSIIDDGIHSEIWVMKEYDVEGSWVKLPTVGEYARGRSSVLWIRDCENVLMEFSGGNGQIAWFNTDEQSVMTVVENMRSVSCFPYVESLELLNPIDYAE